MQFGYFDALRREYVVTVPRTPLPWINYLGSEDFFALMSNTAGGAIASIRTRACAESPATATITARRTKRGSMSISRMGIPYGIPDGSLFRRSWTPIAAVMAWGIPGLRERKTEFWRRSSCLFPGGSSAC